VSKAKLVITAVVVEGRTQAEVAATYGVSKGWVSKLVARYREEGEAAFEPRSKRPKTSPNATPPAVLDLIVRVRKELAEQGHDAVIGLQPIRNVTTTGLPLALGSSPSSDPEPKRRTEPPTGEFLSCLLCR
jgi:transposase-like protein